MTSMFAKVILNQCNRNDKCILEVDGKFFGYNDDVKNPVDKLYISQERAHIFNNSTEALMMTQEVAGSRFTLMPYKIPTFEVETLKGLVIRGINTVPQVIEYIETLRDGKESAIVNKESLGISDLSYAKACGMFEAYSLALAYLRSVPKGEK